MIDKGKYSAHGTMIKKLPNFGLAKWQKTKLAVINPIPSTVPRQKRDEFKDRKDDMKVQSKTMNAIFKFQEKIKFKPLEEDLVKPFLYIQQVMKKLKVQDLDYKNVKPFVTSSHVRPSSSHFASAKTKNFAQNQSQVPAGYINLFEYEEEKRKTAKKLFTKLMSTEITSLKDLYLMWNKRADLKGNPEMFVRESEFVDFMKQLVHNNISDKLLKNFFELYKNRDGKVIKRAIKDNNNSSVVKNRQSRVIQKEEKTQKGQKLEKTQKRDKLPSAIQMGLGMLSIKALGFNYEKHLKSEVQITNIMSEKALKQRYTWVKRYLTLFDENYSQLKQGMNSIRAYEQSLRQHFIAMYASYKNPFQQQILQLQKQLQKPIIKYDKHKKDMISAKIQQLQQRNTNNYNNITQDFQKFIDNFQSTIVKNHDLFFNKRTICKLVLPVLQKTTHLNKELLQREIQVEQEKKAKYVECLSNLIVEIDHDKKFLGEDVFTLADLVELVLSKFNQNANKSNKSNKSNKFHKQQTPNSTNELQRLGEQFVLKSMKKLIKQIKKQYLLKNQLYVEDFDQFPADQEIPMQLLHTCFQMECTKVLAKNHIWSELVNLIPEITVESKLHQQKITCNQCLGYLKKYFLKLDENSQIQRNKSKEISLLIENVKLQDLWYYNDIVEKVNAKLNHYNSDLDDEDQQQDQVLELKKPKKVNFADIAESYIEKQNRRIMEGDDPNKQRSNPYNHEQNIVANDILKAIFNEKIVTSVKEHGKNQSAMSFGTGNTPRRVSDIPQSLQALKTLSRSFFVPEKDKKLSTNAFDIRFYEKIKEKQHQEQELYRLGTSTLLSHLPKPDELNLPQNDPLKLSTFLEKNITNHTLQEQKILQNKFYQSNVQQGVDSNYYRDKIRLQNRPTRYDSDGKSKYSVLFPVGYYEGMLANEPDNKDQKWYLRAHHVETLTENPLSKKDNLIRTEYESKLDRIPLKKRPDEFLIQENVQRKDMLIQSLQERIQSLKSSLDQRVQSGHKRKYDEGQKVPTSILNKYLTGITEGKQDKDLEMATYEAVLYDLRRNEKGLLVDFRDQRSEVDGQPGDKWWERKDGGFNVELRKDRLLVSDSLRSGSPHKQFVEKLKNREIY